MTVTILFCGFKFSLLYRALERCLELPTHCKLEMPIKKGFISTHD
jgi:hypothetical protein